MTKKYRVSAKQRLELVKEALAKFTDSDHSEADYASFVGSVDLALNGNLTPRNAEVQE